MTTETSADLGGYIKEKRVAAGLTQEGLAARLRCSQPAVCAWELGERVPTARWVAALDRELPDASAVEMLALIEQVAS